MYPISIYALTRINDVKKLRRLERQMSGRGRFLTIKKWEIDSLEQFCRRICDIRSSACELKFYYSFTMPKLGKEFDLLRISEGSIVSIELKSGAVSNEAILHQLLQNKYYLSSLEKSMYFYTFVSETGQLVRLTNSGRLVDADWEELIEVLESQKDCYEGRIEDLFKEEDYLISPITDPGRFLRGDYFLTFQQRDIRKHILEDCIGKNGGIIKKFSITGFTGLPGTGKSILLYDIAMRLSKHEKVCVLHVGSYEKGLALLDERLKRVDFYYCMSGTELDIEKEYSAILIDDGHRLDEALYKAIIELAQKWQVPVIATFDKEDALPPDEDCIYGGRLIMETEGYIGYKLTNRIRLNSELSNFIASVMRIKGRKYRSSYPSVSLSYANDDDEAANLLKTYSKDGYKYIDDGLLYGEYDIDGSMAISEAVCKECDMVVMLLDGSFYYDTDGYLRVKDDGAADAKDSPVRKLYHGLSRARKRIAVVVKDNPEVFEGILSVLQGES